MYGSNICRTTIHINPNTKKGNTTMKTERTTVACNNNTAIRVKSHIQMSGGYGSDLESHIVIEVQNFDEKRIIEYWLDQVGPYYSEKSFSYVTFNAICEYIDAASWKFLKMDLDEIVKAIDEVSNIAIGSVYYYHSFGKHLNYYGQGELKRHKDGILYTNEGSRVELRLKDIELGKQREEWQKKMEQEKQSA